MALDCQVFKHAEIAVAIWLRQLPRGLSIKGRALQRQRRAEQLQAERGEEEPAQVGAAVYWLCS